MTAAPMTGAAPAQDSPPPGRGGAPVMSEATLQTAIIGLCDWLHLAVYHTHDSRKSREGFPDLTIAGPGGVLFRELKSEAGACRVLPPAQAMWREVLIGAGANWGLWAPRHWHSGQVEAELRELRRGGTS